MTDFRALCARMADELDHYRQLLMDDRRATHALAAEARAALAQPEMHPLADLAATLIADSKQLNPEVAAVLTPEALWDLYGESPTSQPEPQGPTDEDRPMPAAIRDMPEQQQRWYALGWHAALARWGRPAIEPVPVSEHLPGPEDCDAEGRCWWLKPRGYRGHNISESYWILGDADRRILPSKTHWLPHWALPVPGVEGSDA